MIVALIGTGVMGVGIAQVLSASGAVNELRIISRTIEKGHIVVDSCKRYLSKLSRKGVLSDFQLDKSSSKITISTNYEVVIGADLVIEAVSEDYEVKSSVFMSFASYVSDNTVVASNTSSLSITGLASLLPYSSNVVGLHFFNPAPLMELVEIVVGHMTDPSIVENLVNFTSSLGKTPVIVKEAPGFIVNRMLIPMINEAISILSEGVATKESIDKAMQLGAHHPMGPLKLADLIGNDVVLSIMESLYSETGDPKYRANPLLRKMVRAKYLGRKTKKGFFNY